MEMASSRRVCVNIRDPPVGVSTKPAKPNDKESIILEALLGPLGPIMESDDGTYIGLISGHVFPDGDRALVVKTDDGELMKSLGVEFNQLEAEIVLNPEGNHSNTTI